MLPRVVMSLLGRLIPNVISSVRHSIFSVANSAPAIAPSEAGGLFTMTIRNVIRCHFPRPSERKRIKRHGWKLRMSTDGGRRVLMRKILKGRHVYSH